MMGWQQGRLVALAVMLVAAIAGCAPEDVSIDDVDMTGDGGATPEEVVFRAVDYGYEGPASVPAGMTELVLENSGQEIHHIQLYKLDEGKTMDDVEAALESDTPDRPDWVTPAGGPNAAMPGQSVSAFVDLEVGTYVMMCDIPSQSDGVPHSMKGMVRPLEVTASQDDSMAEVPAADITIDGGEFYFDGVEGLVAGEHTFRFRNVGRQEHEIVLVSLEGDATPMDFVAAFEPGSEGPPPGAGVGGTTGIPPGGEQAFTVDLAPGRYGLICFLPDEDSGTPHAMEGMVADFEVAEASTE